MNHYLSQGLQIGEGTAVQTIQGPLDAKFTDLASLVNVITKFMIPLAAIVLLASFVWAGFDLVTSEGNADKIKSAQGKFTTGIIGFVLLVFGIIIVRVLAVVFGLNTGIL